MKRDSSFVVYAGVGLLALIWGSTWLAIKIGLEDAPPFRSAAPRFLIASAMLYLLIKARGYRFPHTWAYWKRTFFLALFMYIIPYALVYWGEVHISSGLAAILFSTHSLFVVAFAHFLLQGERATLRKCGGLLLGLLGLVLVFRGQVGLIDRFGWAGMAGLLIAAASGGGALVWLRRSPQKVEPVPEVAAQLGMTGVAFVILGWLLESGGGDWSSLQLWASIGYLAILGTALAFVIFYALIKRASALAVSFSIFAAPVFAVVLGWIVLGEALGFPALLGTVFVIGGIIITQTKERDRH